MKALPVDKQRYLGITFDNRLNWSSHVSKACESMAYYLNLINNYAKNLPSSIVKMLIESLVFSRYIYSLCGDQLLVRILYVG